MRPPEARQISMARSRAQSECEELSTGTKTSLYGMTPPSAVMGSLRMYSELLGFFSADIRVGSARRHPRTSTLQFLARFAREELFGVARAPRSLLLLAPNQPSFAARDMECGETCVKGG